MTARMIVLVPIVLFGCRGTVLHAETNLPLGQAASAGQVAEVAPLQLGAAQVSKGGCAARPLERGGLSGVSRRSMERIPISWRSTEIVRSAWRLEADSELGRGSIVLAERPDGTGSYYVGDGIFAGCSQSTLSSAYERLTPAGLSEFEILQLG